MARSNTWQLRPGGSTGSRDTKPAQYTGQTTRSMRERHYGQRSELKRKEDGVGAHFFDHAEELGINFDTDI